MTCRNKLMNEGKPYPRSGCDVCGSMFGTTPLVCARGEEPNDPTQAKFYIPTAKAQPAVPADKYAVIITDSYSQAGYNPGEPNETVTYDTIQYFDSLTALTDWYMKNHALKYGAQIVKQVIKYTPLKVTTEVKIHVA